MGDEEIRRETKGDREEIERQWELGRSTVVKDWGMRKKREEREGENHEKNFYFLFYEFCLSNEHLLFLWIVKSGSLKDDETFL